MAEVCTQSLDTGFVALGYAKVSLLGVVQGITELLPISSTAHMRVVPALLGWQDPGLKGPQILMRISSRRRPFDRRVFVAGAAVVGTTRVTTTSRPVHFWRVFPVTHEEASF